MRFRKIFAVIAAAGMTITPTVASAANAAPATAVTPASETVDGSNQQQIYGASILLQVGVLVVLAIIAYFAIDKLGGSDKPSSP